MAKWGEGDPRWIVEERADATNVNNWHWTEKNATAWSKEKLKSLLEHLQIEDDQYCCEITEMTKLDGEASASNRKAKLIFFYEWEIKADWKGRLKSSDTSYKGSLDIPNLSEENSADDIDVNVSVKNDKDEAYKVKEFMRIAGAKVIREKLAIYIKDLQTEFSQGMILDAKKEKEVTSVKNAPTNAKKEMNSIVSAVKKANLGVKIVCKRLKQSEEFKCRSAELYRALTERDMVQAFTRGPCDIEAEKGSRFSMFDNNVTGEITELNPHKEISMRWRFKTWPSEHYSNVTITLEEKDDCTKLTLNQTGVPENDFDRTNIGWKNYYWQSIKQTFGFGASLY